MGTRDSDWRIIAAVYGAVALLVAVFVAPIFTTSRHRPHWGEGVAYCGAVCAAMRDYAIEHQRYPVLTNATLRDLSTTGVAKCEYPIIWFDSSDFSITSTPTAFRVTVTASSARGWPPSEAGHTYTINHEGKVRGTSVAAQGYDPLQNASDERRSAKRRVWLYGGLAGLLVFLLGLVVWVRWKPCNEG